MTIAKTKKGSIVWSIKHRPPLSITMITAILLALQSSKGMLIHNLPIDNKGLIEVLSGWYSYILDSFGALFTILCVVLGLDTSTKPHVPDFDPNKASHN